MPGSLPATGFGMPNFAALPTDVPINSTIGIPPPDQQAEVIAEIKAMMASPDPAERAKARAFMRQHGRSFLGTAANTATGGFTDWLMTQDADTAVRGYPLQYLDRYTPEEMVFANRLSREITPGEHHGEEMAGTAAKIGLGLLPAGRLLRMLQAGLALRGTPPRPGPAPAGPAPAPGGGPGGL
jgi:hypothetical protein